MSPRAACRLEALGFDHVYDYVLGIADWKAAGLPLEGQTPDAQRVADATRPDVPTCRPDERLGDVAARVREAGWDECIVTDCDGLVVGRLRNRAWDQPDATHAGEVMELGPSTARPNGLLAPLVERMAERGTKLVTVTTPQGQLIGALLGEEGQRLLAGEAPERIWVDCDGCPGQWRIAGVAGS